MRLFYTTHERGLTLSDPSKGVGDFIEFTDKPLAGYGDITYLIDIPEADAKPFEFTGEESNLIKGVRYFEIPTKALKGIKVTVDSYLRLTGSPWNQWTVILKEEKPDAANTEIRVWVSKKNVVTVDWLSEKKDQVVQLTLSKDFDPDEDYLILETRQFFGRQWNLEILAGVTPEWVDFPIQWSQWVQSPEIRNSAIRFLKDSFETVRPLIEMAENESIKINQIHAWRLVANKIGEAMGRDIGAISAGSKTSTLAMPIRIAERIGNWKPPMERPTYVDPDKSGRVMIAAPRTEEVKEEQPVVFGTNVVSRRFQGRRIYG